MKDFVFFASRDELFRINLSNLVYCEADGNLCRIVLANGSSYILGISLARMGKVFSAHYDRESGKHLFARVGKRFIINMHYLLSIHVSRQELVLSDQKSFKYCLNISKEALKTLKTIVAEKNELINQ